MDFENSNADTRYSTPKRKVLGDLSNGSPVSPMANLRLLTKVATSPVQTELPDECVLEDQCNWPNKITPCSDTCGKKNFEYGYVRRTKSLSVLCEKFLTLFPLDLGDEESRSISIKHMATELGVEKRRVYDIVNIVESLDMARKFAKDSYIWFGNQNVPTKVASLHKYALTVGLDKLVEEISEGKNISSDISPLSLFSMDERRIGVLCQKFVMLLLVCHNKLPVTLDMATSILTGGSEPNKTKSRRLYDISNMLLALGIVKKLKTEVPNNPFKKPAFVYSGPCYDLQYKNDVCEHPEGEQDRSSLTTVSCQTEIVLPASVEVPKLKDKLNLSTSPVSWISIKKPIAKKRLVFNQDLNIVFKPVAENVIHKKFDLKTCKPLGSIVLHRPKAKLEPGSLYKAVKIGGAMQLVKIP